MNARERNATQASSTTLDTEEAEILDFFGIAPPNPQHSDAELRVDLLFLLREIYWRIWNLSAQSVVDFAHEMRDALLGVYFGLHMLTQSCDWNAVRCVIDSWNAVILETRRYALYILARFFVRYLL